MLNYKSFISNEVLTLSQIDSTNSYAHELIANKQSSNGLLIVAKSQQNGKGQRGNVWYSGLPDEQFSGSLILHHLGSSPQNMFLVNMAVSLAVVDTLKVHIPNAKLAIKWSNDIFVNDKKIGGILIENIIRGNDWTHSIIGIGLNVNNIVFPEHLIHATSIKQVGDKNIEVGIIGRELLFNLNIRLQLALHDADEIMHSYNTILYKQSEIAHFVLNGQNVSARIYHVDSDGYLYVELDGEVKKFSYGEIKQVI